MLVITERMDAAMTSQGFRRSRARWRRDTQDLPIVVYQEHAGTGGPRYGFTILFGFPQRNPDEWGCFQISQGEACGRGSHYYDVDSVDGRKLIEQDFLMFTAATAGRFQTANDLISALERGDVPTSAPGRGPTSLVKDMLDIAEAHGLDDARRRALELARALDATPAAQSEIRDLARFRPAVADAIGWAPGSDKPHARRSWRYRS